MGKQKMEKMITRYMRHGYAIGMAFASEGWMDLMTYMRYTEKGLWVVCWDEYGMFVLCRGFEMHNILCKPAV